MESGRGKEQVRERGVETGERRGIGAAAEGGDWISQKRGGKNERD